MMYEGKNIHHSSTDNKLLCSFSGKLCNQRRLNGYGFCVRHILEDPTAPFKRCAYVAKSSNQMCTQAIPKNEDRRYCNNHMQVLGMLPKKERKKKDKVTPVSSPESGLLLPNGSTMKPKFSLSITKDSSSRVLQPSTSIGEPDDPYAFPDTAPSDSKSGGLPSSLTASIDSVLGKSLQSGTGFVRSASDISSSNASLGMSGGSMIAKYYPELAEKLEKMRAKPEPKASPKSRAKSSRTMNKLQTKIAQNKINEKLRKSQELSQTDSNSSPIQLSSPETGVIVDQSPGSSPAFSPSITNLSFSPQSTTGYYQPAAILTNYEQGQRSPDIPPLPQVDTSLLATLATQDNMGFQTTDVECNINSNSRLLPPHTPPRLPPPPYPGSSVLSQPSPIASSDLPSGAFSPRNVHVSSVIDNLNPSLSTHHPQPLLTKGSRTPTSTSVSSLPFSPPASNLQHLSKIATPLFLSPTTASSVSTTNPALAFSSALSSGNIDHLRTDNIKTVPNHSSTIASTTNVDILSLLSMNRKPLIVDTSSTTQGSTLPSPNTVAAQLSLPPPPPYVPPKLVSSLVSTSTSTNLNVQMSTSRIKHNVLSRPIKTSSVPHTKLRKLKGIFSEKAALKKLKTESATKYYSFYAKQKISNHSLVGPFLCSSDEDSMDEEAELLPWQPDIFSASSDDQDDDEDDEFGTNVPMSMRPTKLSLMKTRLRRQWDQAHQAYRSNLAVSKNHNASTLALIQTIRESGACAVRALWSIRHIKKSKKKIRRVVPKKKKTCCHKSSADGLCTNQCLPYTNHCLRHIMYNIDQQIFDYCTAKFADNTQCCMPVFDIRHELPLCPVHAAKADNYQKQMEAENKKKPRKKSKPAALTRPPRKGKKKKKGRYTRPQKPLLPAEAVGLDSTLSDVDVLGLDPPSQPEESGESAMPTNNVTVDAVPAGIDKETPVTSSLQPSSSSSLKSTTSSSLAAPSTTATNVKVSAALVKDRTSSATNQQMDQTLELEETLSPDFDKQFELPLEQASRLLEESDFQEVVNKMPFEALDLFGKHNDADQEEGDQVPLDQMSATKARDAIEKLLCGAMSEEESMQLAMVLAQNLHTDAELAQNAAALLAESAGETAGATTTNLEGRVASESRGVSDSSGNSVIPMELQEDFMVQVPTNVIIQSQQHLQRQQHQSQSSSTHNMGMTSSLPGAMNAKLGRLTFDPASLQFKTQQQQNRLQQQQPPHNTSATSIKQTTSSSFHQNPSSLSFIDHPHPSQSTGLNIVYGQLAQSQIAANQSASHTSSPIGQNPSFSNLAKTVIRHLPTETQPTQVGSMTNQLGLRLGSGSAVFTTGEGVSKIQMNSKSLRGKDSNTLTLGVSPSNVELAVQGDLRIDRSNSNLISNLIQSSSSLLSSQSSSSLSSSSISSSSSSPLSVSSSTSVLSSSSLSLPSLAKKAKLMNSSPSPVMQHQTKHQQQLEQNLQIKQLKQIQQQQLLLSQSKGNVLRTPSGVTARLNLSDSSNLRSSATPPPMTNSNQADNTHRLSLSEMHARKRSTDMSSPHKQIPRPKTGTAKLKLSSLKAAALSDMANTSSKLTLPVTNIHSPSIASSLPTSSSVLILPQDSPMYKAIASGASSKSLNTVRYTLTSTSNTNPFASHLQKSLFSDPLGSSTCNDESPSESISVTVRHPSSLEAVPTTVRHTLPDTFPTPDSLPSSPLHLLPKSSSVASPTQSSSSPSSASSSPHRLALDPNPKQYVSLSPSSSQPSASELHSVLSSQLCSPRSGWVKKPGHHQQITGHAALTNGGLPSFTKTNSNHELTSKLNSPSSQSVSRSSAKQNHPPTNKQHHPSSLAVTSGVPPVVCSSLVTMSGFAPPLPAAAFKTTGTS